MTKPAKTKFYHQRVFADPAGVLLIILAGLLGWLPGPGGMPLLYAGLKMLSYNNAWADKLLRYINKEGLMILHKLFPDHHFIMFLWDIFVVLAVAASAYLFLGLNGRFVTIAATALGVWAIVAFLSNRKRFVRLLHKLRNKKSH